MSETVKEWRKKFGRELRDRAARKYPMPLSDPPPDNEFGKAMHQFAGDLIVAAEIIEYGTQWIDQYVEREGSVRAKLALPTATESEVRADQGKMVTMRISVIPHELADDLGRDRQPTGPATVRVECACGNVSGWPVELIPAQRDGRTLDGGVDVRAIPQVNRDGKGVPDYITQGIRAWNLQRESATAMVAVVSQQTWFEALAVCIPLDEMKETTP